MSQATETFLVTHAEPASVVLREVSSGQIHTVNNNPGMTVGEVIVGTVTPTDATGAVHRIESYRVYPLDIDIVADPPTESVTEAVENADPGTLKRREEPWGERHILAVPDVETAVTDIAEDLATRSRAARLGATQVTIKGGDGVVSVEYRQK